MEKKKRCVVAHGCDPSTWGTEVDEWQGSGHPELKEDMILKKKKEKEMKTFPD